MLSVGRRTAGAHGRIRRNAMSIPTNLTAVTCATSVELGIHVHSDADTEQLANTICKMFDRTLDCMGHENSNIKIKFGISNSGIFLYSHQLITKVTIA